MQLKEKLLKFGHFLKRRKWVIMLVLAGLSLGGFFVWDIYSAQNGTVLDFIVEGKKEPELFPAPLSGLVVEEDVIKRRPLAIVVENHPDARPQSGLNQADLVFETFAEGGITRFLAVYHSQDSDEIGPVRSARNYFVEWADSFGAIFAHVGGSDEALALINSLSIADVNQFAFGNYFWRDSARYAPHNVYTTTAKIREAAESRNYGLESSGLRPYDFKDDLAEEQRPTAQKFTVNFNYSFAPTYTYVAEGNHYTRQIAGSKHLLASGDPVIAKNVAVLFADIGYRKIRSSTYTIIDTVDSGSAYYYLDGKKIIGKWSRTSRGQIKFLDASGEPLELNKGTTWVDVVPTGTAVK